MYIIYLYVFVFFFASFGSKGKNESFFLRTKPSLRTRCSVFFFIFLFFSNPKTLSRLLFLYSRIVPVFRQYIAVASETRSTTVLLSIRNATSCSPQPRAAHITSSSCHSSLSAALSVVKRDTCRVPGDSRRFRVVLSDRVVLRRYVHGTTTSLCTPPNTPSPEVIGDVRKIEKSNEKIKQNENNVSLFDVRPRKR